MSVDFCISAVLASLSFATAGGDSMRDQTISGDVLDARVAAARKFCNRIQKRGAVGPQRIGEDKEEGAFDGHSIAATGRCAIRFPDPLFSVGRGFGQAVASGSPQIALCDAQDLPPRRHQSDGEGDPVWPMSAAAFGIFAPYLLDGGK